MPEISRGSSIETLGNRQKPILHPWVKRPPPQHPPAQRSTQEHRNELGRHAGGKPTFGRCRPHNRFHVTAVLVLANPEGCQKLAGGRASRPPEAGRKQSCTLEGRQNLSNLPSSGISLVAGLGSRPQLSTTNPHPLQKPQRGDIFVAQGKRRRSAALGQASNIKPPSPRSGRRRSITTSAPHLLWPFAWQANAISKDTMFEFDPTWRDTAEWKDETRRVVRN